MFKTLSPGTIGAVGTRQMPTKASTVSYQSKWNVRLLLKYLVFSLPLGVVRDQLLFGIVWNGFEISGTRCTSAQAEQQEKRQH